MMVVSINMLMSNLGMTMLCLIVFSPRLLQCSTVPHGQITQADYPSRLPKSKDYLSPK